MAAKKKKKAAKKTATSSKRAPTKRKNKVPAAKGPAVSENGILGHYED